jgi:2-dehydro-3-deoxyphosphooctonate aldolase (KDO 8-P synthase)
MEVKKTIRCGDVSIGPDAGQLAVIAGPCMAESLELCLSVAEACRSVCERLGLAYIFKASFDKANRTSGSSPRGPGLQSGLAILSRVKHELGVPICTDVHEVCQVQPVAQVADMVQVPAFLCRQTDLLMACARSGRCVNIKKGQFMAPWDMRHAADKVLSQGNDNVLLTERGASFGYNALVFDPCSLAIMRSFGCPVCMDVTHAVQSPGGGGDRSAGHREFVPVIARAAAAVGIDAIFIETHPEPEWALSDSATMLPLADLEALLGAICKIDHCLRDSLTAEAGNGHWPAEVRTKRLTGANHDG